ncbi:hypothetical protein GCM10011594_19080 [Nakamurella endophytica]|uniref:Uncharacterized protein n=1 Tax=Nakamurella endophytica TaxID=1748367 RepID=A0A917SV46_9ACTN|nr:hypothetical protein GCM10011594_19080 [Nakamurella endophytica]
MNWVYWVVMVMFGYLAWNASASALVMSGLSVNAIFSSMVSVGTAVGTAGAPDEADPDPDEPAEPLEAEPDPDAESDPDADPVAEDDPALLVLDAVVADDELPPDPGVRPPQAATSAASAAIATTRAGRCILPIAASVRREGARTSLRRHVSAEESSAGGRRQEPVRSKACVDDKVRRSRSPRQRLPRNVILRVASDRFRFGGPGDILRRWRHGGTCAVCCPPPTSARSTAAGCCSR